MTSHVRYLVALFALLATGVAFGQRNDEDDRDDLRIAALEALISAPPAFALPRVRKILEEDNSDDVKESALFILSQIDDPEAQALLANAARTADGDLQIEAIEMVGIGGDPAALASLKGIYDEGTHDIREAVLEAYLIAHDTEAVYEIAVRSNGEEFETAVETLGAMGARDELQRLHENGGMSDALMEAYAVSGDYQSLVKWAMDDSDPELQAQAIEYLGITGGDDVGTTLVNIYRSADDYNIKEAALEGMLIANYDTGIIELYRESTDLDEKAEMLEYLTHMQSDQIWEIIDSALKGER